MKKVTIDIFEFSELCEDSKENAINNSREIYGPNGDDYTEIHASMKAFRNTFQLPEHEIKGLRILSYLWNNHKTDLYKGKYYSVKGKVKPHKRIKTSENFQAYYSAIQLGNCCVLTGVCFDDDILKPLYDFMSKPDKYTTLEDLYCQCKQCYEKCLDDTEEYLNTDEYMIETIEANEVRFLIDGTIFNY